QQVRDGVALGVAPSDDQRLQRAVNILVAGAGAGVGGAVGVQVPAVGFQQFFGGVDVDFIAVQVFSQPVGVLGVLDLGQAVGGVDDRGVTAGVLARELVTVQAVGNGLADGGAVGGEDAAVELDLAVAVAVVGGVGGNALLDEVEAGVDGVSAAGLEQQVDGAGLQLVDHRV